jgi:CubicO group peptidase (beta-lactamase class C family)
MATLLNEKLLEALLKRAEETHSDAVVVMHKGELVGVWRFGKPKQLIHTMSVTKSIVNLAIGKLITDGLMTSVNEAVCTFYPEWKQGRKKNITLRHLLNHTSGIQQASQTTEEIYASPDFVQLALCAELAHDPGSYWEYNNKAVNLLPSIVERVSREKFDSFMAGRIFKPLGIREFEWAKDSVGNSQGMAGLVLFPEDLAVLGQLVLNKGHWQGEQIIEPRWLEMTMTPLSQTQRRFGLLWWLEYDVTYTLSDTQIDGLRTANAPEDVVAKLEQIKGSYHSEGSLLVALRSVFGNSWMEARARLPQHIERFQTTYGDLYAYHAEGYLGQHLYIFPKENLVFVRVISDEQDSFGDFEEIIRGIAKSL